MSELTMDPSRECVGWLCRHGELNLQDKWDGWGSYVLSQEGRQSAEKAGQWLAYQSLGRVIASDLPRAYQTAEIIMSVVNASCTFLGTDPNLRSWAIGDFTGKTKTPERKEQFQYYRDNPEVPIPNGESWNQFRERVQVAFQYLCSPYKALPTLLVIHNSVIKALLDIDAKGDLIDPGGIIQVFMTPEGKFDFQVVLGATQMDSDVLTDASCG